MIQEWCSQCVKWCTSTALPGKYILPLSETIYVSELDLWAGRWYTATALCWMRPSKWDNSIIFFFFKRQNDNFAALWVKIALSPVCVYSVFHVGRERGKGGEVGWEELALLKVHTPKALCLVTATLCKLVKCRCPSSVPLLCSWQSATCELRPAFTPVRSEPLQVARYPAWCPWPLLLTAGVASLWM